MVPRCFCAFVLNSFLACYNAIARVLWVIAKVFYVNGTVHFFLNLVLGDTILKFGVGTIF